ncbi:MAG: hypothetical protein O3C21_01045 [Verrucomicrobia bacterium]|nr:hypothetical protein [Verrucomicrobiota bacterium]
MGNSYLAFVLVGSGNVAATYWNGNGNAINRLDGLEVAGLVSWSLTRPSFLPANILSSGSNTR